MTARRSPFLWSLGLLALVLLELAGCATTRQPAFRTTLLPAAVEPPPRIVLAAAPPDLEPTPYAHEMPGFLNGPLRPLPEPSIVEPRLRNSEARFQAGRRLFQAGEMEAARREFDRAIDILLSSPEVATGRQDLERRLAELVEAIHRYDVSGLGAAEPDSGPVFDKSPIEEIPEPTFPIDPKLRNQVAEELKATASQLPLELNDEVVRYINYFSSVRGRKTLLSGLRRAGRYRALIRRIFDEEGIPQELIHLAQAESGFSPRAVSRRRASGMWQFMLSRGQEYGLVRTKATDDRLDPEKATRAAARHLRDLYNQFGDWYLAMAAYNCGPVNVQKAIEKTGYVDFWTLRRLHALPRQTENYVPIILATALIAKTPKAYGFDVQPDPPLATDQTEVTAPTDLRLVAQLIDRPPEELIRLNPGLLRWTTPANDPHYSLHLPPGTKDAYEVVIAKVPPDKRLWWRAYKVGEGETLTGVAKKFRLSTVTLKEVNQVGQNDPLAAGTRLLLPLAPGKESTQARVRERGVRRAYRYRVRAGDTIELIADRFDVTPYEIRRWNRLKSSRLVPGTTLRVQTVVARSVRPSKKRPGRRSAAASGSVAATGHGHTRASSPASGSKSPSKKTTSTPRPER